MAEVTAKVTAKVEGIQVAIRRLAELDKKARRRIVSTAARSGLRELVKVTRSHVPVRSGALRASMYVSSVKLDRMSGTVSGEVRSGKQTKSMKRKGQDAYYAHMVHGGVRPHVIKPKRARAMTIGSRFAMRVQHPGHKANPFMERAASSGFSQAIKAFQDAFAKKLSEELAK